MELVRKGIDQLRREGLANAQKKVDNAIYFMKSLLTLLFILFLSYKIIVINSNT